MQVYVVRKSPIQELKEFDGRVLNGVKEGAKEIINDIERTAIASGLENGIKGGISGYKQIREFNAVMKNGYTSIVWSFGKGFVRGWREYGK